MDHKIPSLDPSVRGVQRVEFSLPWPDVQIPEYKTGEHGRWKIDKTPAHKAAGYFLPYAQNPEGYALWRKDKGVWGRNPWMSTTALELHSMMPHVAAAKGRVLVCGLGLGLVAYNMAMMPHSHAIGVVEKDESVIRLFESATEWRSWTGARKLIIQPCDAFDLDSAENTQEGEIDFLYVDIWKNLGQSNALADTQRIQSKVRAKTVGYWGQELDFCWWVGTRPAHKAKIMSGDPVKQMQVYEDFVESTGLPLIGTDNPRYPGLALACGAIAVAHSVRTKDEELAQKLFSQAFFFVGITKSAA